MVLFDTVLLDWDMVRQLFITVLSFTSLFDIKQNK
jgi:hypothetical protein